MTSLLVCRSAYPPVAQSGAAVDGSLGAHIGRSNEFIGREVWVWVCGRLIDPSSFFSGEPTDNVETLHARSLQSAEHIADASCSKASTHWRTLLCLHDLHQPDRGRLLTLHRLDWRSKHEQLLPVDQGPSVDKHRELESERTHTPPRMHLPSHRPKPSVRAVDAAGPWPLTSEWPPHMSKWPRLGASAPVDPPPHQRRSP